MHATAQGRLAPAVVTCAVVLTVLPMPVAGQQWRLSAHAGRIHSALDPSLTASSLAVGARYDDASSGLRLSVGVPMQEDDALQGAIGGWSRLALRRAGFIAGIDVAASGFGFRERVATSRRLPPTPVTPAPPPPAAGHALAGQALPVIGYERPAFQVHARAGASHYAARFGSTSLDRTVRVADVQLTMLSSRGAALMPAVRYFDAGHAGDADGPGAATWAGLTALIAGSAGSVRGGIGHWLNVDGTGTPWSLGATLALHPRAQLEANARRDTYDPLYLTASQTSWSVGLAVRFGGRTMPPAPVPAEYVDGRATIRLPASAAPLPPSIAGDFTGWEPVPMARSGDAWTWTAPLAPGVYHYAFVAADGTWFVPEDTPGRRDDGMGGHVAVLVVS